MTNCSPLIELNNYYYALITLKKCPGGFTRVSFVLFANIKSFGSNFFLFSSHDFGPEAGFFEGAGLF